MRVSSFPPAAASLSPAAPGQSPGPALFLPFSADVFSLAAKRRVPVFLVIGDVGDVFSDPSVCAQLCERTVSAHLAPGERPDAELLCQRASALYSGEGALPLCALLLENGLPFLAAPLPPSGYPADPSRLLIWLTHADRRLSQNRSAMRAQAAGVLRSFDAPPLTKPYSPRDAAHDLLRAALAAQDTINGGFGRIKSPHAPLLSFLSREAAHGSKSAHTALDHALHAMKTGALYDPVDSLFFRATLTEDWCVFVPEKPLAVNAMLAKTMLKTGRRTDAIALLDAIISRFSLSGGGFVPALRAPKSRYTFSPDQVIKALGSEDGLRACRLLGLLHQHRKDDPPLAPSRFSPLPENRIRRPSLDDPVKPLCPVFLEDPVPEDAAFLRRALSTLSRLRGARTPEAPSGPVLVMDSMLAASVFADCGARLGETRYVQAARRTVHAILNAFPNLSRPSALVPTVLSSAVPVQYTCGATAALSLALLALAGDDASSTDAEYGLRLLGSALHTFVREDGMVMYTPPTLHSAFPRVPAIFDSELPSPAALLVCALKKAQRLRPDAPYGEAIETIWLAAAPYVRHEPMSCAGLIDAMTAQ